LGGGGPQSVLVYKLPPDAFDDVAEMVGPVGVTVNAALLPFVFIMVVAWIMIRRRRAPWTPS